MAGEMQTKPEDDSEQFSEEGVTESSGTTYLCAQLWTPTSSWLDLTEEERYEFLDEIATEVTDMTEDGVEILGFAINDGDTSQQNEHRYIAMWKLPSKDHMQWIEKTTATTGWGEYFDEIMIRGELVDPCYTRLDMIKR